MTLSKNWNYLVSIKVKPPCLCCMFLEVRTLAKIHVSQNFGNKRWWNTLFLGEMHMQSELKIQNLEIYWRLKTYLFKKSQFNQWEMFNFINYSILHEKTRWNMITRGSLPCIFYLKNIQYNITNIYDNKKRLHIQWYTNKSSWHLWKIHFTLF